MPESPPDRSMHGFEPCTILISRAADVTTIRVAGEVDTDALASVRTALVGAEAATGTVVIDLDGVTFMSASVAKAVLRSAVVLAADGRQVSLRTSPRVRRVLVLTSRDGLRTTVPSATDPE